MVSFVSEVIQWLTKLAKGVLNPVNPAIPEAARLFLPSFVLSPASVPLKP